MRARIRDVTGLVASVGAGSGKQIAKIASGLAKPDGLRVVPTTRNCVLLDGLPVRRSGESVRSRRRSCTGWASRPSAHWPRCPTPRPANILGGTVGPALHQLAGDRRPPRRRERTCQTDQRRSTFPEDLTTLDQLREAVGPIGDACAHPPGEGRPRRAHRHRQAQEIRHEHLTRSATLPYATDDAATLIAIARRLLLDRSKSARSALSALAFRALGGQQESLFPDLESMAEGSCRYRTAADTQPKPPRLAPAWRIGDDVVHTSYGHGWIQGAGHGVMTVRFETRSTGRDRSARSATTPPESTGRTPSTALTGPTTSTHLPRTQPQRATMSLDG